MKTKTKTKTLSFIAGCIVAAWVMTPSLAGVRDTTIQNKLIGKWTNQNETKGPAVINIMSIDSATGQLRGKYSPPSGAAAGKEFDVVGWVSYAPPVANRD